MWSNQTVELKATTTWFKQAEEYKDINCIDIPGLELLAAIAQGVWTTGSLVFTLCATRKCPSARMTKERIYSDDQYRLDTIAMC